MSINLTVKSGTTRTYPQKGDDDLHGEATAWAQDVTTAINNAPTYSEIIQYDAVVGSAANVTSGIATHSDLTTALAAVSAGDSIYILDATLEPSAQVDISKAVTIVGQGESSVISGANIGSGAVVKISAAGVTLGNVKIIQGIGTPDYALEIAALMERINLNIKADGTFATSLFLNGSVSGAVTGFIAYDTNSVFFGGESQMVEQVKIEDQTTTGYNLVLQSDSDGTALDADRIFTIDCNNGARTLDMSENLTIGNGYDVTITAEDAASSITLDEQSFEVEGEGTATRLFKLVNSSDSARTLSFAADITATGYDLTINVEDVASSITLDEQSFEVEGEGTATRLMKLVNASDAAATLTIDGTAGAVDQDVTSGSGPAFTGAVLTTPDINGGTADALTNFSIRSSGAAFDLELDTAEVLTGNKIISLNVGDTDRSITLGGNITTAGDLITSGAHSLTLTLTAATDVTLPTTGTLASLDGIETFTNKTITAPDINGGTADALTNFSIRSSGAAFDLEFDTSEVLTGNKIISFNVGDTNRSITLGDNLAISAASGTIDQSVASGASPAFTSPTLTTPVLDTSVSGTAILDEDDMASDSATQLATQQSIKAYVDNNGGSGGGVNYIENPNAEVDASGSTSDTNFSIARNTTTPLRSVGDWILTKDAGGDYSTQKVILDMDTIDRADLASVFKISFDYDFTDADYTDDEFGVILYDNDETTEIELVPRGIKAGKGTYVGYAQTHITSTDYELWIINDKTTDSEIVGYIDNVSVGPAQYSFGPVVTDWQSYTLTIGGTGGAPTKATTTTSDNAYWRRVGDSMEIRYFYEHADNTGAAAGAGVYLFGLPSGYTIDTSKTSTDDSGWTVLGTAGVTSTNEGGEVGTMAYANSTNLYMIVSGSADAAAVSATNHELTEAAVSYGFTARVPILGWSSSQQISDDADTRVVAAIYTTNNTDTITAAERMCYDTKVQDTHNAVSFTNFAADDWVFTAPSSGFYNVNAQAYLTNSFDAVAGTVNNIYLFVDGVEVKRFTDELLDAETNVYYMWRLVSTVYMDKGQTMHVEVLQGSGAPHNLHANVLGNRIEIFKLSGPSAIAASETIAARYDTDAGQSIDNTSWEIVNFDSTTFGYDTHGAVTTGASWQFVAPAHGVYSVKAAVEFAFGAGVLDEDEPYGIAIYKNGTLYSRTFREEVASPAATNNISVFTSDDVSLDFGDYIDIRAYQSTGAGVTLAAAEERNWVSIARQGF